VSALTGVAVQEPAEVGPAVDGLGRAPAGVTLAVEDGRGCPRYVAVIVRGVRVGPSPEWLVRRLAGVGARSINNVVDATNYLLHGFGQPAHAFDLSRLAGPGIVVRGAREGERLVTLDGVERALPVGALVIADAERAQAVAGVMGGRDSEVTDATTDVLLEIAVFDAAQVRRTRRALGLSTDASYRFERGVDPGAIRQMAERLARLVVQVAGGTVEGVLETGVAPVERVAVRLRHARVERVLGAPVPPAEVERTLGAIGFQLRGLAPGEWDVAAPTWRHDVARDVDLIEDIARLRGFDALPDELRPFRPGTVPVHPLHRAGERVRDAMVAEGLLEAKPLPFVRGDDATHVRVQNPLAEDEPHLRRTLLESLARRAEHNLARMNGDVRLFEVGAAFEPTDEGLPREEQRAALLVMGQRRPPHFTEPKPPHVDAWDAKGLAVRLAQAAFPGAPVRCLPEAGDGDVLWRLEVDGMPRGIVTRVPLDAPVWAAPAFGVELTLGEMPATMVAPVGEHAYVGEDGAARPSADTPPRGVPIAPPVQYVPLPTQPAAELDLALLVPESVAAADVERVIRTTSGALLERLECFDEFRGAGLPDGTRSLAWRLTFRHPERTLRDKEIDGRRTAVVRALEQQLGVHPRSS
jgi:phenylalanyl-tRNA synthetase beta chain